MIEVVGYQGAAETTFGRWCDGRDIVPAATEGPTLKELRCAWMLLKEGVEAVQNAWVCLPEKEWLSRVEVFMGGDISVAEQYGVAPLEQWDLREEFKRICSRIEELERRQQATWDRMVG